MAEDSTARERAVDRLAATLATAGVAPEEIRSARAAGELGLLAFDRLLLPGRPVHTRSEVAARSGVEPELANRLWRALGFTDVGEDERAFTEADVEALSVVARYLGPGLADDQTVVQLTRVLGSSMARVAEAQMSVVEEQLAEAGLTGDDAVEAALGLVGMYRADWEQLFAYAHLRHLQAAAKRATFLQDEEEQGSATRALAVGFADLVGFTVLSQQLDAHELAQVVDHFETVAYDTVAGLGGRVVKMIGDEVMFVADEPGVAADIGLNLAEAFGGDDDSTPDVRVGIACGAVLPHEGDYFGPVVNLASRIVNIAYAGSVVVSDAVYGALQDDPAFGWKPIRPRRLKGIGLVALWAVTRPGEGSRRAAEVARRVRARRNQLLGRDA